MKPVKAWAMVTEDGLISQVYFGSRRNYPYRLYKLKWVRVEIRKAKPERRAK